MWKAQVSSAVGMIWLGGRMKPYSPVSLNSILDTTHLKLLDELKLFKLWLFEGGFCGFLWKTRVKRLIC